MTLAIVRSRANIGIEAPIVTVEVHLSAGLPGFSIVGLPETAVKESRERVRSAIINSGLDFPQRRITINLAPADMPKAGGRFDLAIAIGILAASGQLSSDVLPQLEFVGELALSGEVRPVRGVLPCILAAGKAQRSVIVPAANAAEAGLVREGDIFLCSHLLQVLEHMLGKAQLSRPDFPAAPDLKHKGDFADVVGQTGAKRALLIAAAGAHNLLMRGPPGTGKTMLASRMVSILPPLTLPQALEVAAVCSIAGSEISAANLLVPPYRSPHHTSSAVALVGGGSTLQTGEISLAHNGVLFLDELPEFSPKVLEVLREPLESGDVQISRARYRVSLPARFQLLAAMNPCPCGYHGDPEKECTCTPDRLRSYQQRLSGPLLDRIDMQVWMPRLKQAEREALLHAQGPSSQTCSADLREQVIACRNIQVERQGKLNTRLQSGELQGHCQIAKADQALLNKAMEHYQLSTRAGLRILRIARTIADWNGKASVAKAELLEAIHYRTG